MHVLDSILHYLILRLMQVMGLHPKLLYQSKQLHHQLMIIFSPEVTPIFQPINHQVSI